MLGSILTRYSQSPMKQAADQRNFLPDGAMDKTHVGLARRLPHQGLHRGEDLDNAIMSHRALV